MSMLLAATSGAQPVIQISAGYEHSLFLKSDGSLWAMGYNQHGQLGDGTFNNMNRPEQIVASDVTAVAGGFRHSLFLKSDGSLWSMGWNGAGELGDGTYNNTNTPELIVASNVTAIAAGNGYFPTSGPPSPYGYSLFLKSDGSLWGMGENIYGQLGDGTCNNTNRPEQIVASNVTAIAAGYSHSLFIKSDGSLWGMGYGAAIGDGTYNYTNAPEQIVASNVTAIAAGFGHSLFLKSDGSLWAMGYNIYGELGDGTYNNTNCPGRIVASNITAIAAGGGTFPKIGGHSLFLKNDGSLWGMGVKRNGQLGDGTLGIAPLYATNLPQQIVASEVTAVAAGGYHSLLLKSDGSLWAAGYNYYGQLGDGTSVNSASRFEQILGVFNQISGQLLSGNNMQLSFVGVANANYALDRSSSLSPPNWIPQATNPASSFGPLVFTNTPDLTTNNFWRIRSVP